MTATSGSQQQTSNTFGYKWERRNTFDSPEMRRFIRAWTVERFGDITDAAWWDEYGPDCRVLDAGCGAGLGAVETLGHRLNKVKYVGVDISDAYKVAAKRFADFGLAGAHMQGDLMNLPFADESFDVILTEGVLHHTDSTKAALLAVCRKLKKGGRILFYVYRTKGPVREFTDDYIRDKLQGLSQQEAWEKLEPLTDLGKILGELDVEIEIPRAIDLLEIPAGKINLQRLFYWHVCKTFYRSDLSFDEMNHINFDWFAPRNAHRQTAEEVRAWCAEAGLTIEREYLEEAGISIIAKKNR
jgi:ubiquinone/menaquinone biosynthesis C-methylase UbiE